MLMWMLLWYAVGCIPRMIIAILQRKSTQSTVTDTIVDSDAAIAAVLVAIVLAKPDGELPKYPV